MDTKIVVAIDRDGAARFLYSDAASVCGLIRAVRGRTWRASHVEPAPDGTWSADMWPAARRLREIGIEPGVTLLGPFRSRGAALAAEARWLKRAFGI